ncbi:PREDICTED: uncharacterized protein LOC102030612 [Chinchilla lanigera]|uniref:uncharacterized protein LOC102030612 n=1 Tax=Chinchilla lanigera TaxID=34839 RepID=UPI000697FF87|nr:PREDICTED: uncharacterized protein LOC102030612 [Chinchilla lanigera]
MASICGQLAPRPNQHGRRRRQRKRKSFPEEQQANLKRWIYWLRVLEEEQQLQLGICSLFLYSGLILMELLSPGKLSSATVGERGHGHVDISISIQKTPSTDGSQTPIP